MRLQEAM